jgi:hypothetical protein
MIPYVRDLYKRFILALKDYPFETASIKLKVKEEFFNNKYLQELDINAGVFLGGSAALLVGLGLGLQDVFKDWFSEVSLAVGFGKVPDGVEF